MYNELGHKLRLMQTYKIDLHIHCIYILLKLNQHHEYRILSDYCLFKKGVTEEFPFDETALVFKVMGKMFTITNIDNFVSFNVKCDPELAVQLREEYSGVLPGYHMNKKHWNTILMDGSIPDSNAYEWIDHSYDLVVSKLPRKVKEELNNY